MTITFASFLLTILIIQIAVAVYAFIVLKNTDPEHLDFKAEYRKLFDKYWDDSASREAVDMVQVTLQCCGVESYRDFERSTDHSVPGSCCGMSPDQVCLKPNEIYQTGCLKSMKQFLYYAGTVLGGIALGIAGVELIGIIFALCLANSIKNAERRGYRV